MIYKPTNFIENTRSSDNVIVKYTLPTNIDIVYSSMGKEITDIVGNNVTTATSIITNITTTSGTHFATANTMRKDTRYGS